MNLLILNYEFPPLGGGAGNATKNLAYELARLGHVVTVVTTGFGNYPTHENIDGYTVIRLSAMRKRLDRSNTVEMISYVFHATWYLFKKLKHDKPDHILTFFALPTGIVSWIMKVLYNIPYSLSLRGGDVPGFLPKNLHTLHRITMPLTYIVWRSAHNIVANSRGLQSLAMKTASKIGKNILYIPNGVNTSVFKPSGNPDKKFHLLFVGRLTEQKGVIHILNALHTLKDDTSIINNIKCTIVGDGPLRGELEEKTTQLGITEYVTFLGWVDRDKLPEIYAQADVLLMPSSEEGMPNVILEAISSGLSIIATNVAGNEELVFNEKNGFLINDVSKIPYFLTQLFHDRMALEKQKQYSRSIALDMGWGPVAESYQNILTQDE